MNTILFLGSVGMPELLIILLIVLLLFGASKIPALMKGLGKGVKSFKDGVNGIDDLDEKKENFSHSDKNISDK